MTNPYGTQGVHANRKTAVSELPGLLFQSHSLAQQQSCSTEPPCPFGPLSPALAAQPCTPAALPGWPTSPGTCWSPAWLRGSRPGPAKAAAVCAPGPGLLDLAEQHHTPASTPAQQPQQQQPQAGLLVLSSAFHELSARPAASTAAVA